MTKEKITIMNFTKEQINKGEGFYQELISKAWESASFKEQLVNNPLEAMELVKGKKMPELKNFNFQVEDQTDESVIYFNIPRKMIDQGEVQLTDEELDVVSGGEGPVAVVLGVATLALACFGAGVALYAASHNHCD